MRAAIFIDGGYFLTQMKLARISPDYGRIPDFFLAKLRRTIPVDLLRCYFYYCAPWMSQVPTEDEQRRMDVHKAFVQEIEALSRWQARLGKLERRWDGQKEYYEQKRVDVLLSIDLVRHATAGHIQHAILVAGDSDFIPAVSAAKEAGVVISLWHSPGNTVHKDLLTLADETHLITPGTFPRLQQQPQKPQGATPQQQLLSPPQQAAESTDQKPVRRPRRPRRSSSQNRPPKE